MKHRFKKITPIPDINHTEVLCKLLECLINPTNITSESPKDLYELYFVFACIWAYGSALFHDGTIDHRGEFSKWWLSEFKSVKFPPGSVFDFLVDNFNAEMVPWTTLVPKFELDPDLPLQSVLVHTAGIVKEINRCSGLYLLYSKLCRRDSYMLENNTTVGTSFMLG